MGSVRVLGVRVDVIDKETLHQEISRRVRAGHKEWLANVNIQAVNLAYRDPNFRDILNRAPIVYCDGAGVRLGARLLGVRLPERIVLTRWVWELAALCADKDFSIFLLGGASDVVERAAVNLRRRVPRLRIAGCHHGYFEKTGPESDRVVELINSVAPNLLIVCFGMPDQEYWACRYLERLRTNLILFGGSTIDYASGAKAMPPSWAANHGLEWLHRLAQEPVRLWRRYLLGNPLFMFRILRQRLRDGRQTATHDEAVSITGR